jgi:predicted AlkP superfamily pyrophosphatase or phosphodiesterase
MMNRTVVLNVVGLTKSLLGEHTPMLNTLAAGSVTVHAVTPAVTCSAQATYLTGKMPSKHGIVANGWFFRELGEIWFWRQSNRLVQSEKIWHAAKKHNPGFTCANLFWWYNMITDADIALTPRPLYCADGRKLPDCYSIPMDLRDRFNSSFGQFPLFKFWGPMTSIESSRWIAKAAMTVEKDFAPTLNLIYLPHLDYVLQRVGPNGDIARDLKEIDALCGSLIQFFQERKCRIIVLSEYGITPVGKPIHPNRILRDAGCLSVKTDLNREYLDPGTCKAFAVADHQIAHVYIKDSEEIPTLKMLFEKVPGVEHVLDEAGKKAFGLNHRRSGELVLVAARDAWFTYYYWNDEQKAPDYAKTVNIHAKPGYDPCELFIDPQLSFSKVKIGWTLLKKILGFRYLLDVIPLDAGLVKGSHGRVTENPDEGPILMTSAPTFLDKSTIDALDVYDIIWTHLFFD